MRTSQKTVIYWTATWWTVTEIRERPSPTSSGLGPADMSCLLVNFVSCDNSPFTQRWRRFLWDFKQGRCGCRRTDTRDLVIEKGRQVVGCVLDRLISLRLTQNTMECFTEFLHIALAPVAVILRLVHGMHHPQFRRPVLSVCIRTLALVSSLVEWKLSVINLTTNEHLVLVFKYERLLTKVMPFLVEEIKIFDWI